MHSASYIFVVTEEEKNMPATNVKKSSYGKVWMCDDSFYKNRQLQQRQIFYFKTQELS